MICLFNSNPITPKIVTIRHYKEPALPRMAEKAMEHARAHLIAFVMQLP